MRVVTTPRAEVDTLCRLALAQYLAGAVPDAAPEAIGVLLTPSGTRMSPDAFSPRTSRETWIQVEGALAPLTILDPACGEGHFLAGMACIVSDVWQRLSHMLDRDEQPVDRRRIVEHNLYGIEVQEGPLACARARLSAFGGTHCPHLVHDDSLVPRSEMAQNGEMATIVAGGGFDLVIGNPPYVRHELILDPLGKLAQSDYKTQITHALYQAWPRLFGWDDWTGKADRPLDGRSDVALYFLLQGMSLVQPEGVLAYVLPTSLFQSQYGQTLSDWMGALNRTGTRIENTRHRSFDAADVNTSLLIVNRDLDSQSSGDTHQAMRELVFEGPPGYLQVRGAMAQRKQHGVRARRSLASPTVRLDQLGIVRYAVKTGLNRFFYVNTATIERFGIEPEFLQPAVKSPREVAHLSLRAGASISLLFVCSQSIEDLESQGKSGALAYISWGSKEVLARAESSLSHRPSLRNRHPWYALPLPRPADFLCPRFFDRRFFFAWLREPLIEDQTFYGLCLREPSASHKGAVAAILNSSLTCLQIEMGGRSGLGDGVRQYALCDMAALPVPDPSLLQESTIGDLEDAFRRLATRSILPVSEEMRQPDRHALDAAVGEAFGLNESTLVAARKELVERVETRLARARSMRTAP